MSSQSITNQVHAIKQRIISPDLVFVKWHSIKSMEKSLHWFFRRRSLLGTFSYDSLRLFSRCYCKSYQSRDLVKGKQNVKAVFSIRWAVVSTNGTGTSTCHPNAKEKDLLPMIHDRVVYWASSTSRRFINDRFWLLSLPMDFTSFVKNCIGC